MHVLGRPPIVNQLGAVLPDGLIDPAAATDCGEANMCSIWQLKSGLYFSPGCIRVAMGKGSESGVTNGVELQDFLIAMGMKAKHRQGLGASWAWNNSYDLRHFRRNVVLLGTWSGPEGHWVLAYEHHPKLIWAMNPWHGFMDSINEQRFSAQFWGDWVEVYF